MDLGAVLKDIIETVRRLTRAEFASVGAVSGGEQVRFQRAGINPVTVTGIAQQLPDNHRPFLGIPITARGELLGTLYLTGKRGAAEFTGADKDIATVLAEAAGLVIENAELDEETQRRQAWQHATTNVTTLLLSGEVPEVILAVLVEHAMRLAGAAGAAITVPTEDPAWLRVTAGSGLLDPESVGKLVRAKGSISQIALRANAAIVTADIAADPRALGTAAQVPGAGPVVAAPFSADAFDGVLLVARGRPDLAFHPSDVEMIASFAEHAGLALALADIRGERELVRLGEDRERIAHHLSEQAMQALLGISTTVHGLTARLQNPDDAHRLAEQVDRLDGVLREMRRAIFELRTPPEEVPVSVPR